MKYINNTYKIELDEGMYGFFTTEWYSLLKEMEGKEDLPQNVKDAICNMYKKMLKPCWEQELKRFESINEYDDFYTKEFVDNMINILKKQIEYVS